MAIYEFNLTLNGEGDTEDEAWASAIDAFYTDPGKPQQSTNLDEAGEIRVFKIDGWTIEISEGHNYLYVKRDGKPGDVQIKAEDEGFVVDIFPDEAMEADASTFSFYTDLQSGEQS